LRDEDVAGSGFAITGYTVHTDLGGDAALARLRDRLRNRCLRLMLDFVPNHVGLDHPWIEHHPDYFIHGTELDRARAPRNFTWVKRNRGDLLLAHGRDPYFSGWPDTLHETLVAAVNYSANQSQCHVRLPFADLAGKKWLLQDQLSAASYDWNGDDLHGRGLFLDMAPWRASVFALVTSDS